MIVPSPWSVLSALVMDMTNWVGEGGGAPAEDVLFHVIGFSVTRPGLEEVEAAIGALVGGGLIGHLGRLRSHSRRQGAP